MNLPVMIIGIGTTGRRTIEFLQMMLYARFRGNLRSLNHFLKLIAIDTVERGRVDWFPFPENIITYIPLTAVETPSDIRQALEEPVWWNNGAADGMQAIANGALQNRPNGRGMLWANLSQVRHTIQSLYADLQRVLSNTGDYRVQLNELGLDSSDLQAGITCYITGSFTGGTCSSSFIDIAHLICSLTPGRPFGLFYIPPTNFPAWVVDHERRGANQCAWSALGDLIYCMGSDSSSLDDRDIPSNIEIAWFRQTPLFEKVMLISPSFTGGPFPEKETLPKVGAFGLYISLITDIQAEVGGALPAIYSFGFSGHYAPVFEVAFYAATERLLECIDTVARRGHNQGDTPHRIADEFVRILVVEAVMKARSKGVV